MMDEGQKVDVIYLNFAKAFISVNHRFLLVKMMPFGLGDAIVQWIEAYLSGRVSRVQVDGELSATIPMRSGVPQGSVIGTLLFRRFVNDLPDAHGALTLLFADDVKVVTPRTQNMNLHSSFSVALDRPQK